MDSKRLKVTDSSKVVSSSSDGTEGVDLSTIPENPKFDVKAYRETPEGKELVGWVLSEFEKAAAARSPFEQGWRVNLRYWKRKHNSQDSLASKVAKASSPDQEKRKRRRTINRIRSFARAEHSKFVSQEPTITVVPSSSEDMDFRAATAGEQVWRSASSAGFLDTHISDTMWWKVLTGNGFLKTYWDGTAVDPVSGDKGVVRYGAVSPFHLFVPDLREPQIEDQPYIFNGYEKTTAWAKSRYPDELEGCTPSDYSLNKKIDSPVKDGISDLPDSVVVLEVWVKPGAHKHLPNGGLLHLVGSVLVAAHLDGIPYNHGNYPYTHFGHLYSGAFYRDCSIDDLIDLQDEYNEVRSAIGIAARIAGKPQFAAERGSITVPKWVNEAGLVVEYNPGFRPPVPIQAPEMPAYVVQQQDRILADFEDISGQHEVSRGQAPGKGVTAGTAIAYLQESDDQYLTPQYRSDERGFEKVARHTLELFVQYVDQKRKIKSLGADRAFDTMMLSGADIRNGTDVRVEKGSTIAVSQVARRAEIKEMFGLGIIDQQQALDLLEMGGAERLRETVDIARSKAQRENIKLQNLSIPDLKKREDEAIMAAKDATPEQIMEAYGGVEGIEASGITPEEAVTQYPELVVSQLPSMIPVDDFDMHTIHIDVHNQFRMSQAYEILPDEVKAEFEKHIAGHEYEIKQQQIEQMMSANGFPEQGRPSQDEISSTLSTGETMLPAPGMPEQTLGEPGEDPTRAEQFKAGVAPQTPGL